MPLLCASHPADSSSSGQVCSDDIPDAGRAPARQAYMTRRCVKALLVGILDNRPMDAMMRALASFRQPERCVCVYTGGNGRRGWRC